MTKRLLYVHRGDHGSTRPFFADALEAAGWAVESMAVPFGAPRRGIPAMLFSRLALARYDLVIANEYALVWALAIRLRVARRPRLVAFGFNQSARLILTGARLADRLLNRIWRRVDTFIVHSREEARLFAAVHGIPADRFVFSHWGYDLPSHDPSSTPVPAAPYVSMIGRNNRDVETFCRAVGMAGFGGVVITSAELAARIAGPLPAGVTILADRSMEECLNYVAGSFAHLVLVGDGDRGAGHISAVSAMLLGKPQIFSDVATIADYLIDDLNGIAVPLADPGAVAAAIARLRDDPALCGKLGEAGRDLALRLMSQEALAARTAETLLRVAARN